MPFRKNVFDVAICKNTLHHMVSRQQLLEAVEKIKHIAKKIILVEIEKPEQT
jgi:ubiquinone/menaquinone biosynthesis C-methylase UbiE